MKKLFMFLAIALYLCIGNRAIGQVDQGTTGSCTWTLTGSSPNLTLTISGTGAMGNYNVNGFPIPSYTPWYSYRNDITTLSIQQGVTTIGNYAFYYCALMSSATIPNSVTSIGNNAFQYCSSLASISVGTQTPPSVGTDAFSSVSPVIPVHVPCGSVAVYQGASGWSNFSNITGNGSSPNISVQSNDNTMGNADVTQANTCANSTAIITATPNTGYQFVQWNDANTQNPRIVTVTQDTVFTAIFTANTQITYQLILFRNNMSMGIVTGDGNYAKDSTAIITATPNAGYRFIQWSDSNTNNPRTITVTQDTAFMAFFDVDTQGIFHISVIANNSSMGTVTGSGDYAENSTAIITATANTGYQFIQWNDANTQNPRTVTVTQDTVFTAEFSADAPNMYHVTILSNNGTMGTVTGSGTCVANSTIVITATPNTGYRFIQWSDSNTDNPRTITVTSDTTFTAEFDVVLKASIKTLEPNVNPFGYNVKNLATVYRYYKVVDEDDNPVSDAQIAYTVSRRRNPSDSWTYETFYSEKSGSDGVVTIAFKVFGEDPEDASDDKAYLGGNPMAYEKLYVQDKEITVIENAFANEIVNIIVSEYLADEYKLGLSFGLKATAGLEVPKFTDFKLGLSAGAKLSFTSLFEGDNFVGRKYELSADIKVSGKGEFDLPALYPIPKIPNLNGHAGGELFGKFNLSKTVGTGVGANKLYLSIAYDVFYWTFQKIDNTDVKLHEVLLAIGYYLNGGEATYNMSSTVGFNFSGGFDVKGLKMTFLESLMSANFEGGISGRGGFEFGAGLTSSANSTNSNVNFKYSFNGEAKGGFKFKPKENFGASISGTWASSIKFDDNLNVTTGEKKNTTIKLEKGQETELEADIDIWNVKAKSGKNYVYKYTLEKPVFDYLNAHPNTIPITTGLWNYWRTLSGIIPVGNSTERVEDALNDGMALLDYSKYPALKGSYTFERTKEYSASATISKKIGTPKWASWFGIDWSVTISGGVFMQSTFPLEESKYDFVAKEMRPVVEYEDLNKFAYYLPRLTWKDEIDALIDDIKSSLDLWDIIQDYAKSFRKTGEKHASAEKIQFSNEEGNRKKRLYSSQLKDYNKLQKDNRTGISTMSFDIAGNNQVFENNTRLSFSYYYPGGEVLGATVGQDTFIIISDVFYLHAYYQDSVSMPQAPYGNFKVFSEAGSDDLAFLDIHPSYSVGLYHQPLLDSLWRLIGNTNDTVSTNSLGTYCLGVKVSDDDIPPVINIMKNDNTKTLEITVTDNMAVYWKGVYVIVNGLLTECLHNGNTLTVNLTEEQLNDEIYVLVYASDLARNESQASSVFDKTETPPVKDGILNPVTNSSDCKVYPNPVLNNVYVFISDELRGNSSVKYIIVSPLGQTHLTGTIYKEETIINVEKLASGVYFIIVYDENKIITHKKIVKQ